MFGGMNLGLGDARIASVTQDQRHAQYMMVAPTQEPMRPATTTPVRVRLPPARAR
jgi:hypothetical protein